MGRRSKTLADYENLAQENNLTFTGKVSPRYTTEKTNWCCNRCGRDLHRSYWSVQRTECFCQTRTLQEEDYHRFAEEHGLKWIGPRLPKNAHEKTTWANEAANNFFQATYNQLNRNRYLKERQAHA